MLEATLDRIIDRIEFITEEPSEEPQSSLRSSSKVRITSAHSSRPCSHDLSLSKDTAAASSSSISSKVRKHFRKTCTNYFLKHLFGAILKLDSLDSLDSLGSLDPHSAL
jgi:hypothetical protein